MKKVEVKERVPAGEPTHTTIHPEHLRAWEDWTQEDIDHELAMSRELGNHDPMPEAAKDGAQDEALKLLGSFARFVQKESPQAAETLGPLAMEWARAKGIPQDKLLEAIMQANEWGG
jgi:hypothetical protein